jgi:hypothetical protein
VPTQETTTFIALVKKELSAMAILRNDQVKHHFRQTLPNAAGKETQLLNRIEAYLHSSDLPGVTWEMVKASSNLLTAFVGRSQEFLRVKNYQLSQFRFYVGAQSYGAHLDVVEYVSVEPGIIGRFFSNAFYHDPTALFCDLSVLKNEQLQAFVTVVHQLCVQTALAELTDELKKTNGHTLQAKGSLSFW